jgi:O-antigen/teichoic acid export membrane protein
MGVQFFIMQISSVILFMTSNLLISKLFTPALVTPYQITYRYFSLMLVAFTVICMPFWNATTDAFERGDIQWIRHATRKLRLMIIGIMACMVMMVILSPWVYSIWIGDDVTIDIRMSIVMAAYIFILIYSMRYSYFINGIGKLRLQLIFTSSAAIVFIPLAWLVVRWTGDILCFMAVMCMVNIPGLIANRIQFYKLINNQATGIWNR